MKANRHRDHDSSSSIRLSRFVNMTNVWVKLYSYIMEHKVCFLFGPLGRSCVLGSNEDDRKDVYEYGEDDFEVTDEYVRTKMEHVYQSAYDTVRRRDKTYHQGGAFTTPLKKYVWTVNGSTRVEGYGIVVRRKELIKEKGWSGTFRLGVCTETNLVSRFIKYNPIDLHDGELTLQKDSLRSSTNIQIYAVGGNGNGAMYIHNAGKKTELHSRYDIQKEYYDSWAARVDRASPKWPLSKTTVVKDTFEGNCTRREEYAAGKYWSNGKLGPTFGCILVSRATKVPLSHGKESLSMPVGSLWLFIDGHLFSVPLVDDVVMPESGKDIRGVVELYGNEKKLGLVSHREILNLAHKGLSVADYPTFFRPRK